MTYIDADYKNTHKQEKRVWKEIKTGFTHFAENDVAIAKISPCFENRKSVILHNLINGYGAGTTELFILRTTSVITSEYLLWIVKTDDFINAGVGNFSGVVGQQRLAKDVVENYLMPLPPFEEQQRIVSSINDAFSQINLIENNSTDLQTAIKQAKSKILDLAIHGKLVPQDPTDEPAEELLKRIATSDNRPYTKLLEDEIPYKIPNTWSWCRLKNICTVFGRIGFRGYTKEDLVSKGKGAITLSPSNLKNMKLDFSDCSYISWYKYAESPEIQLEKNDIVVVKTGSSYGKTSMVEQLPEKTTLNPQLMVLKHINCNEKYLCYFLNTSLMRKNFEDLVNGTAIPTFSQEKFGLKLFPLPPLTEQQRIVSKIEELYSLLDSISSNLE